MRLVWGPSVRRQSLIQRFVSIWVGGSDLFVGGFCRESFGQQVAFLRSSLKTKRETKGSAGIRTIAGSTCNGRIRREHRRRIRRIWRKQRSIRGPGASTGGGFGGPTAGGFGSGAISTAAGFGAATSTRFSVPKPVVFGAPATGFGLPGPVLSTGGGFGLGAASGGGFGATGWHPALQAQAAAEDLAQAAEQPLESLE